MQWGGIQTPERVSSSPLMSPTKRLPFTEVATFYRPLLLKRARIHLQHEEAAQDAVQETLAGAWQSYPHFKPGTNLWGWLVTILNRIMARRRKEYLPSPVDLTWEEWGLEEADPQQELPWDFWEAQRIWESLPPLFKQVIWLHDVEGWTHNEIAAQEGVQPGAVKMRLHRAKQEIQRRIQKEL